VSTSELNFRYSKYSRDARRIGNRLLYLTRAYEGVVLEPDQGVFMLAVAALVARARHLLRSIYVAADRGDALAAAILTRALTESVLLLAWLNKDPEVGELVWMLDDIRTGLSHHKEVAEEERRQRSRQRRAGEPVEPVPQGRSLGLLGRADVRQRRKIKAETTARLERLPDHATRLSRMRVTRVDRIPSFAERAQVVDAPWIYSLAYRFDSNAAAHPTPLALSRFLEQRPEGIEIRSAAGGAFSDPYLVSARLFGAVLDLASERVDQGVLVDDGVEDEINALNEMAAEIQAASAPGV
jgi:Family of unknown function (DUF5677)